MIYRHTFSNGLRVVIEEIPFVRSVSLGVWVGTGSRDEPSHLCGISHFLEHMFFKGTATRSARQLAEVFDNIGGQVNAFTAKEYTCFHAKVLDEHVSLALETIADMLFASVFAKEDMELEKGVVIEEIKMYEDNPEESVHDAILEETFSGHPLGANILGTEAHLRSFTKTDLLSYIDARYTQDNMVISLSGRVDAQAVLSVIEPLFGSFSRQGQEYVKESPVFTGADVYQIKPIEQVHVCLAVKGFSFADEHSYPLVLLNNILGSSSSSRLFQEIREERGMAYNVFSYHTSFRDTGLFTIYFGSSPAKAEGVLELVGGIVRECLESGVSEAELEKAKNQVKGSLLLSLESTSSRMTRIGKNELLLGRQIELDETIAGIDGVTAQDIETTTESVLAGPFSFVAMGPQTHTLHLASGVIR